MIFISEINLWAVYFYFPSLKSQYFVLLSFFFFLELKYFFFDFLFIYLFFNSYYHFE